MFTKYLLLLCMKNYSADLQEYEFLRHQFSVETSLI